MRKLKYSEAINEAIFLEMKRDNKIIILGLGCDDPKGIFGTTIGLKGAKLAANVLALSIKEILENPEIIIDAKNELNERTGDDFIYKPLLGDRKPPLDYRKN